MISFIVFIHVFVCLFIIGLVLLQQGKGANLGASFGGGGDSLFGASGADNLLTKITTFCAIMFMCTSLSLAILQKKSYQMSSSGNSLIDLAPEAAPPPVEASAVSDETKPAEAPTEATPDMKTEGNNTGSANVGEQAQSPAQTDPAKSGSNQSPDNNTSREKELPSAK